MAGYSDTRLPRKRGIKEGFRIVLVNAPEGLPDDLGPLPSEVTIVPDLASEPDMVLLFAVDEAELRAEFARYAARLVTNGMLWVAWPKKSSRTPASIAHLVA